MTEPQAAPRRFYAETPNYIVRTIEPADANERWCKWLLDPVAQRQLNAAPVEFTMEQLHAYIARFDGVRAHLTGIFEKPSGRLVGIRSIYVDLAKKEFLFNVLIGEPDDRGKRARTESLEVVFPFFFEELGMLAARCSILADNEQMLALVISRRWTLERTELKTAANGGPPRKLHHFRLTREAWRARRATSQPSPEAPPRSGS